MVDFKISFMALPKRRPLLGALVAAVVSASLSAPLAGLNDTDGLVREGLFPLAGGGASLGIVSETVSLTLQRNGRLATVREYRIQNRGKAGMYTLGALCSQWTTPCREAWIDGIQIRFWNRVGRLAVRKGFVEVQKISRARIAECEKYNDGDICGHVWAEFPIWFDAGRTRTVSIHFETTLSENSFFDDALDGLHLDTERFWAQTSIPSIEFRFAIEGANLTRDLFEKAPGTEVLYEVTPPSSVDRGAVVWQLQNSPGNERWLVHPFGIDLCALYQVYRQAGGHYPRWPEDQPRTPCSE